MTKNADLRCLLQRRMSQKLGKTDFQLILNRRKAPRKGDFPAADEQEIPVITFWPMRQGEKNKTGMNSSCQKALSFLRRCLTAVGMAEREKK